MGKILLIEFNELSPTLLKKWMAAGKLPNFKKLYQQSKAYISKPDVDESDFLEPWIQWYSMHVGVGYDEHKVFHLTDGAKADNLDIWSHLKNKGKKVASFASMNTKSFAGSGNLYLPDPWCTDGDVFPNDLDIYQRFITSNVQEHTNINKKFSMGEYAGFLMFMLKNGLSFGTIFKIIKQLATEKLKDKNVYWKRVALLDRIQMDLFKNYYKKNNFEFTTFFANSTAHLQHAYWRYMEPEAFENKPSPEEMEIYKDAVLFGYQNMDELIGEMLDLIDDDTMLILASALSQKPFLKKEAKGGQNFYRPHNVKKMLLALNINPVDVQPTMTHQFMLRFDNKLEADNAKQKLTSWTYGDNKPVFDVNERGDDHSLYFGNQISTEIANDMIIHDHFNEQQVQHSKYFYRINETKSGCHHPDGVLWFKTGNHQIMEKYASILDVFPTVCDLMAVTPPDEIKGRGKSLAAEIN